MSYVLSIRRGDDHRPIVSAEVMELLAHDPSLREAENKTIIWTSPTTGQTRYLNQASDHLWTDDVNDDRDLQFLQKLQSIARALEARLFGEEGEDLTESLSPSSARPGCAAVILLAVGLTALALAGM